MVVLGEYFAISGLFSNHLTRSLAVLEVSTLSCMPYPSNSRSAVETELSALPFAVKVNHVTIDTDA